ncbi:hypothetical protein E2562_028587 [Oryza meyeriana var. granulata]|uniref:Uncharacterized protein n=1 Tax=Oryza meyeriana var. granulata TaxID=110450 RepID=A0A6G1D8Q3_9ORYZ|nr:hypothetical protein E2562_028587 [Oryza meyeriana var. granulata]
MVSSGETWGDGAAAGGVLLVLNTVFYCAASSSSTTAATGGDGWIDDVAASDVIAAFSFAASFKPTAAAAFVVAVSCFWSVLPAPKLHIAIHLNAPLTVCLRLLALTLPRCSPGRHVLVRRWRPESSGCCPLHLARRYNDDDYCSVNMGSGQRLTLAPGASLKRWPQPAGSKDFGEVVKGRFSAPVKQFAVDLLCGQKPRALGSRFWAMADGESSEEEDEQEGRIGKPEDDLEEQQEDDFVERAMAKGFSFDDILKAGEHLVSQAKVDEDGRDESGSTMLIEMGVPTSFIEGNDTKLSATLVILDEAKRRLEILNFSRQLEGKTEDEDPLVGIASSALTHLGCQTTSRLEQEREVFE